MNITVKYFGMLAEATAKEEEILLMEEGEKINNFSEMILSIYPNLQEISFKIAVNQNMEEKNIPLKDGDELALLPPFAGG